MKPEPTVDVVICAYLKCRQQKAEVEQEAKDRIAVIQKKTNQLEAWLQAKLEETGVKSFNTTSGTAFLTTSDYARVADWDAVLTWVKENDAFDMLTHGVNKTAVRGYIEADNAVPNGVTFGTVINLCVRSPTKKE